MSEVAATRRDRAADVDSGVERATTLARRFGYNATALQTLAEGFTYFFPDDEACVPYVDTGGAWVGAGAPFVAPERLGDVARAFVSAARGAGRRACFFAVEDRFAAQTTAEDPDGWRVVTIGLQPVWDPREWERSLAGHRSLREQLRRARAKDVAVRRLTADDVRAGSTRSAVLRVAERWLAGRSMAPMGFIVRCEPFALPELRQCFVAERNGEVVGFAGVLPVPARAGWFVEHLLRDPSAPNGTAELLVDAVMRWAAAERSDYVTLGLAPLAGDVGPLLELARATSRSLYDFEGLRRYKEKLRPTEWAPVYLAFPRRQSAVLTFVDALRAFARGGFVRFGVASLVRGPTVVLEALTALLVPWIALLAAAPTERWFAHSWIKWGWITFDVIVLVALARLVRKPTVPRITRLATAISVDATLTSLQALTWNLPRARSFLDVAMTLVACAAPTLAAVVLWGARRRLRIVHGEHASR